MRNSETEQSEPQPWDLRHGDALDLLADSTEILDESVHAIVTDPPYGINFMPGTTNGWDDFDPKEYQDWCQEWAEKALRVVKPGGHLLAFSGERTFHRLMCGVEDAGWTVRTSIMWLHGEGFPKGTDVSKHIDRYYNAEDEREVVGKYHNPDGTTRDYDNAEDGDLYGDIGQTNDGRTKTAPATSMAERWDGWKSQLKPAHEPIVVARKPLSEDAIYKNVLEHGTGAYNIDATRIPHETVGDGNLADNPHLRDSIKRGENADGSGYKIAKEDTVAETASEGRYPPNVALDEQAAAMLDAQSGELSPGGAPANSNSSRTKNDYGEYANTDIEEREERINYDSGGASRFYYTSKAPKSERTHDGAIDNDHPTVKPVDLMSWLVRMVTREGQTVLDPFTGSGTTGVACLQENRLFLGIEREQEYLDLAVERLQHTLSNAEQQDLGAYAAADDD